MGHTAIIIGRYLSAPLTRSREYKVWLEEKGSPVIVAFVALDFATTYKVFVVGSMTGVLVIPVPQSTEKSCVIAASRLYRPYIGGTCARAPVRDHYCAFRDRGQNSTCAHTSFDQV